MTAYKYSEKTIFILGQPRSGTTWLSKIFDAHPDVLYRHEPDIRNRALNLPFMCDVDQVATHRSEAELWLNALATSRQLKSVGTSPIFAKSYHSAFQTAERRVLITGLKLLQNLPTAARVMNSINVPDFIDLDTDAYKRLVIKSVSGMGRAGLFAAAAPESRIIVIMRHPCGQVESMLRGVRTGMFEEEIPLSDLWKTTAARRFGCTKEQLAAESFVGRLAWNWVIQNETAMEALKTAKHVKLVRYGELAERPEATARMLLEFCDIEWRAEVADFLVTSTRAIGYERYYQIKRDPLDAATRWRRGLSSEDVDTITRIASRSELGRLFLPADTEATIPQRSDQRYNGPSAEGQCCVQPQDDDLTAVIAMLARQLELGSHYLRPGFRVSGPIHNGRYSQIFRVDVPGIPSQLTIKLCRDPEQRLPDVAFARHQYETLRLVHRTMKANPTYRVCRPIQLIVENAAIVQEWAPGRTLAAFLLDKDLTPHELRRVARSTALWCREFHKAAPLKLMQPSASELNEAVELARAKTIAARIRYASVFHALSALERASDRLSSTWLEHSWLHHDLQPTNIVIGSESVVGLDITGFPDGFVLMDIAHLLNSVERLALNPRYIWRRTVFTSFLADFTATYLGQGNVVDERAVLWFRTLDHIISLSRFYRQGRSVWHDRYFETVQLWIISGMRRNMERLVCA